MSDPAHVEAVPAVVSEDTLLRQGALAQVRFVVEDDHGRYAAYRVELWAEPAGHHDGDPGEDVVTALVSRVCPGSEQWRRSGAEDDAEPATSMRPGDEIGVAFVFPASGPGRLLPHEAPTGDLWCVSGCEVEIGDDAVSGDECPSCGMPLLSVMAPDGKTFCPRPCVVRQHDEADHPVGSVCPECVRVLCADGELSDPVAHLREPESDDDCDWCGRDGSAEELLAQLVELARSPDHAKLRALADHAADLLDIDP